MSEHPGRRVSIATITLQGIRKTYGGRARNRFVLGPIDLTVGNGESMVILGPSGCGKTTLLRIIAGLITPDAGEVLFDGQPMAAVPPRERRIGMVFQSYALYPHLSTRTNILAYFFFRPKTPELTEQAQQKYQRTSELMGVELEHLLGRRPGTLSPGERQRVAVARCITRDPNLFLLDEPFSSLDQNLRERYRTNLKRLLGEFSITTVYVTHDQQEALLLADRIALMDQGRLVQVGRYRELYERPRNAFVAGFLNPDPLTPALNLIPGERVASAFVGTQIGVRPEDLRVAPDRHGVGIDVVIEDRIVLPTRPVTILVTRAGDTSITASVPTPDGPLPDAAFLRFERFHVFDAASGTTLESYP